jgi:hypothetical protein
MKTPIDSSHPKALGAPTFATAAAALRSCLKPRLTPCAPSASSSAGGHGCGKPVAKSPDKNWVCIEVVESTKNFHSDVETSPWKGTSA